MKPINAEKRYETVSLLQKIPHKAVYKEHAPIKPRPISNFDQYKDYGLHHTPGIRVMREGIEFRPGWEGYEDVIAPVHVVSGFQGNEYAFELQFLTEGTYQVFSSPILLGHNGKPLEIPDSLFESEEFLNSFFKGYELNFQAYLLGSLHSQFFPSFGTRRWADSVNFLRKIYEITAAKKSQK